LGSLFIDKSLELGKEFIELEQEAIGKKKTSFLLHGPPGNGKTTLIRNLAKKYGYDLYYVDLGPDTVNMDILSLTAYIPNKAIVLFEDFDALYDGRTLLKYEKPKFSFDAILNLLDGVYSENNQVIFAFTCNDVNKIDDSLLNRRGRLKHVIEVGNPDFKKRLEIFGGDLELAEQSEGMSLDGVYHLLGKQEGLKKLMK
jgi:SpoVK/Ycf46/Vps4 family AAA+-type ATPase